jgi:hypothetical protein
VPPTQLRAVVTAPQYLVLCELGRFDACRLGIFPSHEFLARRARCSVRTVQRALEAARALGLVDGGIGPPSGSVPPGGSYGPAIGMC